jgi:hypothetical protein
MNVAHDESWVHLRLPRRFEIIGKPLNPASDAFTTYKLTELRGSVTFIVAVASLEPTDQHQQSAGIGVMNGDFQKHARFQATMDSGKIVALTVRLQYCNMQPVGDIFALSNNTGFSSDETFLNGDDLLMMLAGALPLGSRAVPED